MSGSIPSRLTDLRKLTWWSVSQNDLTGPMPNISKLPKLKHFGGAWNDFTGPISELPTSLEYLYVSSNDLHGPLPASSAKLHTLRIMDNPKVEGFVPLDYVNRQWIDVQLRGTGVCIPASSQYDAMRSATTESKRCVGTHFDKLTLNWLFEEFGGKQWSTIWDLSDDPGDRDGVTVTNGRVTGIDLSGAGLSGEIDEAFTWLSELEELNLSDNGDLDGRLTERYLQQSLNLFDLSGTSVCAPQTAAFDRWLSDIATVDVKRCADRQKAIIKIWPTMNQAIQRIVQDPVKQVYLVEGRPARLRVWVTANKNGVYEAPELTVRVVGSGWSPPMLTEYIEAPKDEVLHIDNLDGKAGTSYDMTIPADYVTPGMTVYLKLGNKSTPITNRDWIEYRPIVTDVPAMELTIVPIYQTGESKATRDVADAFAADTDKATAVLKWGFPLRELDVAPRSGIWTDHRLTGSDSNEWLLVMDLVWAKHDAGETGYWYAVSGLYVRGVAETPRLSGYCVDANGWTRCSSSGAVPIHGSSSSVSFGRATSTYLAHEVGHTLNLMHAPCRVTVDVDPGFPYDDGTIGQWGYDFYPRSNWNVDSKTPDLMGYCTESSGRGGWLSDYNYEKVMAYRDSLSVAPDMVPMMTRGPAVVISGQVVDGRIMIGSPIMAGDVKYLREGRGPYRIDAMTEDGLIVYSGSFSTTQMAHAGETFMVTIPVEDGVVPSEIMVTGPDGVTGILQMDDAPPVTVVRDRSTGEIVGIFRNGPPPIELTGPGHEVEAGISRQR
ncbi:MAG: hypothetical protein F4086_06050 [Gemmatimonadetes bacterium]|nr:hypothetical protein [Gammaproteobacteria bacterium]MYE94865.1 hypothetical protein [Gemmatimonadota bacterium]MYJ09859.1 hypothetical protein [Gemmatimonadota bacterium]